MTELQTVGDYLNALDNTRYAIFKADIENDRLKGIEGPTTLQEVYRRAMRYVVPKSNPKNYTGAAFATRLDDLRSGRRNNQHGEHRNGRSGRGGLGAKRDNRDAKNNKPSTTTSPSSKEESKVSDSGSTRTVVCWHCGDAGHVRNNCPDWIADSKGGVGFVSLGNAFNTQLNNQWYEVLLDNQANISVLHPRLLSGVRSEESVVRGLSGETVLPYVGHLAEFDLECKSSPDVIANVLCMADVEDKFDITYRQGDSYTVHLPSGPLVFRRRDKLYVADMRKWASKEEQRAFITVKENEEGHSTADIKRARAAYEFIANTGYCSFEQAKQLVNSGSIIGLKITAKDIDLAKEIYGFPPPYVRGRRKKFKAKRQQVDMNLKHTSKIQTMYADLMYVRGKPFLLSLSMPLGILLVTEMLNLKQLNLGEGIQGHVSMLQNRGFLPTTIYADPQSGMKNLVCAIPGIEIDISGAGDHMDLLDVRISHLKEVIRSTYAGLPFKQPSKLDSDLVKYCVSRKNLISANGGMCPRVLFTGRHVHAKELSITYGSYVECYNPTVKSNRIEEARTEACIALYPTGNANGSWFCLNLATMKRVCRTNIVPMVMNETIIGIINNINDDDVDDSVPLFDDVEALTASKSVIYELDNSSAGQLEKEEEEEEEEEEQEEEATSDVDSNEDTSTKEEKDRNIPTPDEMEKEQGLTSENVSEEESGDEDEIDEVVDLLDSDIINNMKSESDVSSDEESKPSSYFKVDTQNYGAGKRIPKKRDIAKSFCYHTSVKNSLREHGHFAYSAIVAELKQMIREKRALSPVHKHSLSNRQLKKVIRSFMFLKTKFDGLGRFEKIKARLVANGKQQDREMYPDVYSPTVQLVSVLMCLVVAAAEDRKVATVDIGGAYLNADRKNTVGEEIIMEIEPLLVAILSRIAPEVKPFVDPATGKLYVKLDKALYGTLDAAKLWYERLSGFLKLKGFVPNAVDPCVFNKIIKGVQITLLLYVDDLLILCVSEDAIMLVIDMIKKEFAGDVKYSLDGDLSYLGMHIQQEKGSIKISMQAYVEGLMKEYNVIGKAASPATTDLFRVDANSPLLHKKDAKLFHTVVAKLLYLSKRVRVDTLLAVSFLTTRVKSPTEQDERKLQRVLKYLNGSVDQPLLLKPAGELKLEGFIDAAFGCHNDGKSHTGVVIMLGNCMVASMSSKQKIVSKDSTEAELAALSDKVLSVVQCGEFLREQGLDIGIPTVYQDNTSCIQLVTKDGGVSRTKYFNVRRARVREFIDNGTITVTYLETRRMLADLLTKPLQGALFRYLLCCIIAKSM
jgi:hypothetical protein